MKIFQGVWMRIFFAAIFLITFINANSLENFQAFFIQTVTSQEGDAVNYEGEVFFSKNRALWHYKSPNEKLIYINQESVTIIEPLLEQAVISEHNEMDKIQSLLQEWIESGQKNIEYDGITYQVVFKNKLPVSIEYKDALENKVTIKLSNIQTDNPIKHSIFIPNIPQEYDIVRY
jgi:outer membrane lipoprotein carrier protein